MRTERPLARRVVGLLGWIVAGVFAIEMAIIAAQAARGTTSHFNLATPLDATLYSVMGVSITVLFAANVALAALLAFLRFDSRVFGWSVRLGLIIAVLGMGEGFLMTDPTAQQLAGWQAGEPVTIVGAHSVGVPDGGPGLPGTGWSTTGGDLRIGHFVGMHALQVLPFVGWFLSRRRNRRERSGLALVSVAGAGYLGLTLLFVWQALRAQPVTSPDGLTLAALGILVAAVGVAVAAIERRAARPTSPRRVR